MTLDKLKEIIANIRAKRSQVLQYKSTRIEKVSKESEDSEEDVLNMLSKSNVLKPKKETVSNSGDNTLDGLLTSGVIKTKQVKE